MVSSPTKPPASPDTGEFFREPLKMAWTAQADALVLVARETRRVREQIIGLTNATTLPGDNFMVLAAYGSPAHVPQTFTLERALERAGGVPPPFESLGDASLNQSRDRLGAYFWKEYDDRRGTNCVLALRRLEFGARILPANTAAMEVVLRNCVNGPTEEALAPLRPEQLSVNLASASINGGVRPRVRNPLAAPEL